MICQNCGASIPDGSSFCPKCGTACGAVDTVTTLPASGQGYATSPAELGRTDLLALMNTSFEAMTRIKNQEDRIEDCDNRIAREGKKIRFGRVLLFGLIGFIVGLFFDSLFDRFNTTVTALIGFVIGAVGGVALNIIHGNKQKEIQKEREIKVGELEGLKTDPAIAWLPYDYRDSISFAYIYRNVQNMRANNLTEAINVYETDKHQARLELISMVSAQSTADAASAANTAAGAAAASAFFSLFR